MSNYIVYALTDPENNKIRYIGKSVNGAKRILDHGRLSCLKKENKTHKTNWIKSLKKQGLNYGHKVIFSLDNRIDKSTANLIISEVEKMLIMVFKKLNLDLTNSQNGGEGSPGRILSEISRQKMSNSAKKRGISDALKKNQVRRYPIRQTPSDVKRRLGLYNYKKQKGRNFNLPSAKPVIAMSPFTGDCYIFSSKRMAARSMGGTCSKTGITMSIKTQKVYYNYLWLDLYE